jgi:malonyl-ACP O-methyltransferase BioC
MQYKLVSDNDSNRLVLFFAGWAMDAKPFEKLHRDGYDTMVVWDYRQLDIDWRCVSKYDEICVLAWSMGVYAASRTLYSIEHKVTKRVAINGTLTPVDDTCGIPINIFEGTLSGLNERTLVKFYRRVAGSRDAYDKFAEAMPQRDIEELRNELSAIYPEPLLCNPPIRKWDCAIIGREDAIFPAANQARAWQRERVKVKIIEGAHLVNFQQILDYHIIDKQLVAPRFDAGQVTYDRNAVVQQQIIDVVVGKIRQYRINAYIANQGVRVLEIGSGTGMLTTVLSELVKDRKLTLWDVVDRAPKGINANFTCCDAELKIAQIPPESYEVIASTSTMQWFNSPAKFLRECARVLSPGGYLVLTTFEVGNLAEISDITGNSLPLLTAEDYELARPESLSVVDMTSMSFDLDFDSPLDALRHMKYTGVNALSRSHRGAVSVNKVLENYSMRLDGKWHLTYKPLIMIYQKNI